MMDLDGLDGYEKNDISGMIAQINDLPIRLANAWEEGMSKPITNIDQPTAVILSGVGMAGISAELVKEYISPFCKVPVVLNRDYDLPAWAGSNSLVILVFHNLGAGINQKVLDAARRQGCSTVILHSEGDLFQSKEAETLTMELKSIDRAYEDIGGTFGQLLALFERIGLIPDQGPILRGAVNNMLVCQKNFYPSVATRSNPAKRLAGQLFGRDVVLFGAGGLIPVARYWKSRINQFAKAWAHFEALPDASYNSLAGLMNPQDALMRKMAIFLCGDCDYPANQKRIELTRQIYMLEGLGTDFVGATGNTPLENIWSLLHLGDYVSYFLAIAYQVDPSAGGVLEELDRMIHSGEN